MREDLTEQILDRAHAPVVGMDEDGRVTYWNPSAERTFGIRCRDALGRRVAELIIPERMHASHEQGLRRFLDEGVSTILDQRIEISAVRVDGSEIPVELTVSAAHDDDGGWRFHAFILDISDRVNAERQHESLVEELRAALRGSERRFDAIVGSLPDPVTIRDREHRFLYANKAALEHLGFATWEELRETPPAAIMSDYVVVGEDGREITMEQIPSVRILSGEEAEPLLMRIVNRMSGREQWLLMKSAPLADEHGEVEATITIIEDVTEQKRAELRGVFLAEASATLASSLDYAQTLHNVAELTVPKIADWCLVDLLDEDGVRRTMAVAHADPARIRLAEQLRAYTSSQPASHEGVGRVLASGEAMHYREMSDEILMRSAVDEPHLELLRTLGLHSALIVPLCAGEKILGAMTLVTSESGRELDEFDLELAEQLAARAAIAIENARLYSERSRIARTLQQSLLPENLPAIPGYELASMYVPALETSLVGGDFYDIWELPGAWMLVIGDVTGKGVDAAALTAVVRHTLRTASEFDPSPARMLALVDSTLRKRPTLSVCTALCARLENGEVTFAVGGHPLPLHLTESGAHSLGSYGPLLGAFPYVTWEEFRVSLPSGTTLLAYTDGVTDARGEGHDRFGLGRLCETVAGLGDASVGEIMDTLSRTLERFQTDTHTDDTAAIALRRLPEGAVVVERGASGELARVAR